VASQQLITQRLSKEKDQWQAEIRKNVEVYLGEKSAEREYNLEARKRLYAAIGPLKFQLLIACRDVAARVTNYAIEHESYSMNMREYYGQSTLYRLIRPIAIAELIERQITYADFSVDPTGIDLLRFKRAALTAFTDGDSILHHPHADWGDEIEHVFSGTFSRLANALIVQDEDIINKKRSMHFHEFETIINDSHQFRKFSPLSGILNDFSINKKPIFWIRLVCFGYICNEYVEQAGASIGFQKRKFDLDTLLTASKDEFTSKHVKEFEEFFQTMLQTALC